MKILIVEDDQTVAQTLQFLLSDNNYAVDIATDGEVGLQMAEAFDYDLILLDVILPKLDGVSVCQQLRSQDCHSPILLLTGQREERQKAIALNAGADDYVVKPFDAEELMARVQALLRRGGTTQSPILTWGRLSIDPSSRKVAYGKHLLSVTPKEYAILELFLRYPQKLFNAPAILNHAWSSIESPGEEAVRVHIKELRQKLTAVGAPRDFIKTKHRVGYQLNPQYSNFLAVQVKQHPTAPQVAELSVVNEQLRLALESLQVVEEELRQQNHQLSSAQQMILLEQQRYRDLFEFAPDAYLVTNTQGVIQEANRAASSFLQVTPQYLIGKPLTVFIARSDRRDFHLRLAHCDFGQNWEANIKPRVGKAFPALIAVTSIKTWQNEVIGLRWLLRDIHARKAMEQQLQTAHDQLEVRVAERTAELITANQALRQREEFLSSIYHGANQGVFVIEVTATNDFYYSSFNHLAEQLAGDTTEALQGKTPEAAFGASIGTRFRQNYERCLQADQSISYEEYIVFKNHTIWTLTTLSPLRDQQGRIYRIIGTAIDISERKQLELSLQASESKLSRILNSAFAAISSFRVYANRDWEYEYWSAGCEKLFGYDLADYTDKYFWMSQVFPDDRDQVVM
ncbi:MAG TPA: PAS domain S-box protein, partial [Microcoleaceae cyanobacterium]